MSKVSVLDFLDSYKYQPKALVREFQQSPLLKAKVLHTVQTAAAKCDWPEEWHDWTTVVFGLLAGRVLTIASPILKNRATRELFEVVGELGLSSAHVSLMCGEAHPLEQQLRLIGTDPL